MYTYFPGWHRLSLQVAGFNGGWVWGAQGFHDANWGGGVPSNPLLIGIGPIPAADGPGWYNPSPGVTWPLPIVRPGPLFTDLIVEIAPNPIHTALPTGMPKIDLWKATTNWTGTAVLMGSFTDTTASYTA